MSFIKYDYVIKAVPAYWIYYPLHIRVLLLSGKTALYKIVKRYFEDVNEHEDIIDLKRIHAGWEVRVYKLSKSDIYHNADINQILTSQEYVSQRWKGRVLRMLSRKARFVGSSMVITIPSQLAEIYGIEAGDKLNIMSRDTGILIRKRKEVWPPVLSVESGLPI